MEIASSVDAAGRYRIKKYRAGTNALISVSPWIRNKVSTADTHGLNIIARRLSGNTAYDIVITQAKIGTGTTAPTESDTDLEATALSGIPLANQGYSGAQATLEFFIPDVDLADGTYTEFGIFAEDQLIARSLILPTYTKASNEDTSIEYIIAFSNAS